MNSEFQNSKNHDKLDSQTDEYIISLLTSKSIKLYNLEKYFDDYERCVALRRKFLDVSSQVKISESLDYKNFPYRTVLNKCCENVIGFVSIPVGVVGPIFMNGESYFVPMATTEGCLVASTNRGATCVSSCGIRGILVDDGMTRAPLIRTDSALTALSIKNWIAKEENFNYVKEHFDATSRYARLKSIRCWISGRSLYMRFKACTGDAMGMNMVSKGVEASISMILENFKGRAHAVSLSGNCCSDKKPTSINWIEGRGKSVVCEATIPRDVIISRLNVTPENLVALNTGKNLVGSAVAGSIGGFNANSANIVAAIFTATGQDLAQVVESSNCITFMEMEGSSLYVSCTMPSLEVGTVGGGTNLPSQHACLSMMRLNRSSEIGSTSNLALVICSAVLCSELSLLASLSIGTLVSSHMKYNRYQKDNISCNSNQN